MSDVKFVALYVEDIEYILDCMDAASRPWMADYDDWLDWSAVRERLVRGRDA